MKFAYLLPLLGAIAAAVPMPAADAVYPPAFRVQNVTYGGSGCPQGSLTVSVASSGGVLGLVFANGQFVAHVGSGYPISDVIKNCQLNFDLLYSPGFQFQVYTSEIHGHATIASGTSATIENLYYFSGSTDQQVTDASIDGPFKGAWTKSSDEAILIWSPCGTEALFNAETTVRFDSTTGSGLIAVDKETATFAQFIYLRWQAC